MYVCLHVNSSNSFCPIFFNDSLNERYFQGGFPNVALFSVLASKIFYWQKTDVLSLQNEIRKKNWPKKSDKKGTVGHMLYGKKTVLQ